MIALASMLAPRLWVNNIECEMAAALGFVQYRPMSDSREIAAPTVLAPLPNQIRRDILVRNVRMSSSQLLELFDLIKKRNTEAQRLQVEVENVTLFESHDHLRSEIETYLRVNYRIALTDLDSIEGSDVPELTKTEIQDALQSVYISNTEIFSKAARGNKPKNCVDIYLDFRHPPLALNFYNLPSNPTQNGSVINVYGYNHDWVNSTHKQLQDFFARVRVNRAILHGSGTYDFFLYCLYLPIVFWLMYRVERKFPDIFTSESRISIIAVYIYIIVSSLFFGRIIFQYARWLFPFGGIRK